MDSKSPALIPCTFKLPLAYNDGRPVEEELRDEFLERLFVMFGGWNIEGTEIGAYQRKDTGKKQVEATLKVTVAVEAEQISVLRRMVAEIGGDLDQESMYFEVVAGSIVELVPSEKKGER